MALPGFPIRSRGKIFLKMSEKAEGIDSISLLSFKSGMERKENYWPLVRIERAPNRENDSFVGNPTKEASVPIFRATLFLGHTATKK